MSYVNPILFFQWKPRLCHWLQYIMCSRRIFHSETLTQLWCSCGTTGWTLQCYAHALATCFQWGRYRRRLQFPIFLRIRVWVSSAEKLQITDIKMLFVLHKHQLIFISISVFIVQWNCVIILDVLLLLFVVLLKALHLALWTWMWLLWLCKWLQI